MFVMPIFSFIQSSVLFVLDFDIIMMMMMMMMMMMITTIIIIHLTANGLSPGGIGYNACT